MPTNNLNDDDKRDSFIRLAKQRAYAMNELFFNVGHWFVPILMKNEFTSESLTRDLLYLVDEHCKCCFGEHEYKIIVNTILFTFRIPEVKYLQSSLSINPHFKYDTTFWPTPEPQKPTDNQECGIRQTSQIDQGIPPDVGETAPGN